MPVINSRGDLERLRDTPEFPQVLRMLHGSMTSWSLINGAWVPEEDLATIEAFGFTKEQFLAEVAEFNFPPPSEPGPRPGPTEADVDVERDRRIAAGRAFEIEGYGTVHPDGSLRTQTVLLALKDSARDLKAAGITDPILHFTGWDGDHYLTPDQTIELVDKGKAWMQGIHAAQRALKNMDPIPDDFATNEDYWP